MYLTSNELLQRRLIDRHNTIRNSNGLGQYRSLGFYGVCWCGIREYDACLRETYAQSTGDLPRDSEGMEKKVALYVSYLSMLAEYYVDYSMITGFDESLGKHTQRHKIISLAADYITKNLSTSFGYIEKYSQPVIFM